MTMACTVTTLLVIPEFLKSGDIIRSGGSPQTIGSLSFNAKKNEYGLRIMDLFTGQVATLSGEAPYSTIILKPATYVLVRRTSHWKSRTD